MSYFKVTDFMYEYLNKETNVDCKQYIISTVDCLCA
jgi:hypothetical protein